MMLFIFALRVVKFIVYLYGVVTIQMSYLKLQRHIHILWFRRNVYLEYYVVTSSFSR
jgi:hypothetical protein